MATVMLPKYERVKRSLIRGMEGGQWPAGSLFPSENQLLERFDVSRPTLVRSLQELVSEGYLYRQKGKGTFVAERGSLALSSGSDVDMGFTVFMSQDVAGMVGPSREVQLRILRGIQNALGSSYNGSSIRHVATGDLDVPTRSFIESMPRGGALLIEPSFCPTLRHVLEERGWVVWSLNEPIEDGNCVLIDHASAGYLATKFLIDEGRQHLALINGPASSYWGFEARREGYLKALHEAGLPVDPALMGEAEHVIDSEAGRVVMRTILDLGVPVDGVVGASDFKAIGAMAHAIERGVDVPGQLAFVSIDNTLADQADPPLPAVAMPFEEMGFQAASQALLSARRRHTSPHTQVQICLKPTLVER